MGRIYAVFLLLPVLQAQQAEAPKLAVLEGSVVNSVTGEPLRKTDLTLATSLLSDQMEAMMAQVNGAGNAPEPGSPKLLRRTFTDTTDASGKFRFQVEPGDYYLQAKHAGFVEGHYKPEGKYNHEGKIHLAAGDDLKEVRFRMVPQGAISGRVIDEDGDPVPAAMVTAQSFSFAGGKRRLAPADSSQVNDRGEFRLGKLAPGKYYLAADRFDMNAIAEAPPAPKDGSPEMGYVTTYFPKTIDVSAASPIEVSAGADLTGFVIQLQKSRVTRVKGQVLAADGTPLKSAQIMLMPPARIGSMRMRMVADPQGRFEIANLQPGPYMAMVMQMSGAAPGMQVQSLVVPPEGLDGIKLGGQALGTVSGSVSVAGDPKPGLRGMRVMLAGGENQISYPVYGSVSESGAFQLSKVAPTSYDVTVSNLPEGTYLEGVKWGGQDRLGHPIDFSSGFGGALEIVLGTDGGTFEGAVSRDDKPVAGATVVLLPADPDRRFEFFTNDNETDSAGRVLFKNVPPGKYLAFAWEKVDYGAWFDPAFVKPLEKDAASVTIDPKGRAAVELKLIPASR